MPVKIWDRISGGALTSKVETSRSQSYRGERFRADAEKLDGEIDEVLDRAAALSELVSVPDTGRSFLKRWAVGRALAESGLAESKYLEADEIRWLWLAIARKCRVGVRADGSTEKGWWGLIPSRQSDPRRIERDVFSMGRWLQEQEIEEARASFGASLANAREIHSRAALKSKKMRDALAHWFAELTPTPRSELVKTANFRLLAKALARRFPARGPGSAKRPAHYSENDLYEEVCKVLNPVAAEVVPESKEQPSRSGLPIESNAPAKQSGFTIDQSTRADHLATPLQ